MDQLNAEEKPNAVDPIEPGRSDHGSEAVDTDDVPGPDADGRLSTGDPDVDTAVARLAELDDRPLDEHAEVYADIHRSLGSVLDGTAEGSHQAP